MALATLHTISLTSTVIQTANGGDYELPCEIWICAKCELYPRGYLDAKKFSPCSPVGDTDSDLKPLQIALSMIYTMLWNERTTERGTYNFRDSTR